MSDTDSLLPSSRRGLLLDLLRQQGTIRVRDVVAQTGVSAITVRRDIAQLAEEGLLRRVHGGAILLDGADGSGGTGGTAAVGESGSAEAAVEAGPGSASSGSTRSCAPRGHIGMLVPSLDYYWPDVVRTAEHTARAAGMRLVLRGSSYESDDDRQQLMRLVERGVAGIIVAPRLDVPTAAETLAWLDSLDLPVVLVEREGAEEVHRTPLESVETDHVLGARMAVRHLAELGHQRIGLVRTEHSPHSAAIRAGWAAELADLGLPGLGPDGVVQDGVVEVIVPDQKEPTWDGVLNEIPAACRATGTTALLVHADPEAMSVAQHTEEQGLEVPGDLSIVAYDDEVVSLFSPPMTAVRPPRKSVGRAAVELLVARLADPGRPTHRVVITPSLRVRGTSVPPAGGSPEAEPAETG
ncbi:substrate-binding domain-containing protein [Salana multivorans]